MPIEKPARYTVTSALIYANGPIHIGHLAGCYIPADIYVRYLRAKGEDVIFIGGTDEHGVPITIKAKNEGITPQAVVDKYYGIINKAYEDFGISFDIYSRTSRPIHHKVSQDFFLNLYNKGVFTEQTTEQYFDETANQFLADRYIVGTCPNCGNENAYGDQCEKCGTSLSPEELINPRSTLSGAKPIKKPTKNWYLPLDQYEGELRKFIESHPEWKVNVSGQCFSWLNQGLHPRAMTRDLDWGVQVPLPDTEGKVLYVWFDAPIGYITFTEELVQQPFEKRIEKLRAGHATHLPKENLHGGNIDRYWKDENAKLVHFIGKDNIVFHTLIFPAMLIAHGDYILPDNVPANEFMNLQGDKISTSRNWAIWLHEYLEEFPGKQDVLRYTLCSLAPETKDSDFTWRDFQFRNNSELVAILGNFVNRTLVLTQKYYEGKVPTYGQLNQEDQAYFDAISIRRDMIGQSIESFRFREALISLIELARIGNKYLADSEPWKIFATDPERVKNILYVCLEITASLALLMEPFMPFTAKKLANLLNLDLTQLSWDDAGKHLLAAGHQLNKPELLFEKIEDEIILHQVQKLEATKPIVIAAPVIDETVIAPLKPEITYDDFAKLDIRVATITAAEVVPKTKKLLKLTLDTGFDIRTVVSGIAESYQPDQIIGQQVALLTNLAPRDLKGITSQGMILMAEGADGKLKFVAPSEVIRNGSGVN
jgi:methionyl-tRNA synthetase